MENSPNPDANKQIGKDLTLSLKGPSPTIAWVEGVVIPVRAMNRLPGRLVWVHHLGLRGYKPTSILTKKLRGLLH